MLRNRSIVRRLLLQDIKLRKPSEGTFGLTITAQIKSKLESQLCVAMCDNMLTNVLSIVLLTMTLPEYLFLVKMSSSIVQFDIVIVYE